MRFSVVIPTYNYGRFLPRALESVLAQDGNVFEIIVVDDGSTDDTSKVMADFAARYPGQVRYVRQENRGPAAARNRGVAESKGEYLIFLDADDRLLPDALARFRAFLEERGPQGMVFGGHLSVHPDGRVKKHPAQPLGADRFLNFRRYIRKEFGISNGATVMARRVFGKIRYPEALRNSEDIPVFAQVLALYDCASFPEPVLEVVKHGDSLRNNLQLIQQAGTKVVDILFDPDVLPPAMMRLREEFHAAQCLSLFRALYLAGDAAPARIQFRQALRLAPRLALRPAYLRKYLRCLFRQ